MQNPFRYFNNSPVVIRLAVMMYVRFPLSLRENGGEKMVHVSGRFAAAAELNSATL